MGDPKDLSRARVDKKRLTVSLQAPRDGSKVSISELARNYIARAGKLKLLTMMTAKKPCALMSTEEIGSPLYCSVACAVGDRPQRLKHGIRCQATQ